jgi:hypothetical protein
VNIPQLSDRFVRVNPSVTLVSTTTGVAVAETTIPLAGFVPIPPFTYMIRVRADVTSNATAAGATLLLRDLPGGSDVVQVVSPGVTIPASWTGFLELNGGRVTYAATPNSATSYTILIRVTGFLRYA